MAEHRPTDRAVERALLAVREQAFPPAPALGLGVSARLEAERSARTRPPFPGIAIWSRRRVLAVAALGLLALLALAFGARFVLGAAEVRIRPGATPTGPPLASAGLGDPSSLEDLRSAVGFPLGLPSGPPPDDAFEVRTASGAGALLVWDLGGPYPATEGTPWGLVLLEVADDEEVVVKDVNRFEDFTEVAVGGRPAAWIDAPHALVVLTDTGPETFSVEANVLIWSDGDVTYRLETSIPMRRAIALAETIG
jgi:hypothetical protein